MELLDATIALAVTLAALATSVTMIMELVVRFFGLKSKGQIDLFKNIYNKSFKQKFKGTANEFSFVTSILQNPLGGTNGKPKDMDPAAIANPRLRDVCAGRGSDIYDRVSTEHVFRHLLALPCVLDDGHDKLVHKLRNFNVEYNQLCAAASTSFKKNRHFWSVITGVVLAVVLNVNALHIYETFMANPALTAATVAQLETLSEEYELAHASLEEVIKDDGGGDLEAFDDRMETLQTQLGDLQALGIPIGWKYTPHCHWASQPCKAAPGVTRKAGAQLPRNFANEFAEFITCLVTGMLIGLGAPFWFDVARRLSQVRTMFGGKAGTADSFNGETPVSGTADYDDKTDKLITKLVDEAITGKQLFGTRMLLTERREI